jgi:flagellar hook assembly protein FlgD
MKGQVIRTLVNSSLKAGSYDVTWNGTDAKGNTVASGVYFYRLTSDNQTITKKMLLSK